MEVRKGMLSWFYPEKIETNYVPKEAVKVTDPTIPENGTIVHRTESFWIDSESKVLILFTYEGQVLSTLKVSWIGIGNKKISIVRFRSKVFDNIPSIIRYLNTEQETSSTPEITWKR